MLKMSTLPLEKHAIQSLKKSFGEFCSTELTSTCHSDNQHIAYVFRNLSLPWMLNSEKGVHGHNSSSQSISVVSCACSSWGCKKHPP